MKVYVVKVQPYCEDEETCSCHDWAFEIVGIFTDKEKAKTEAMTTFPPSLVEEYEVID